MAEHSADLIIYGGTSAAVSAAVQGVRMGLSVIVVSPDTHLGGLSSGGLGFTDAGNTLAIGGIAREFYARLYDHYASRAHWKWESPDAFSNVGQGTRAIDHEGRACWSFEPSAAEKVFEDLVREHDVTIYRDEWLNRESGVAVENGRIVSCSTLSGRTFQGRCFIDATYEGDLMAAAGVSYHVGREANSVYDETWNGNQPGVNHHGHWFDDDVSPYATPGDPQSGLLPHVLPEPPGKTGTGDDRIQAYCFRMCLTNHPDNHVPFPRPENYDPGEFELFLRGWEGREDFFTKFDAIPNRKTDTNNHGPFSTDYIGANWDYPGASYDRRQAIIEDHERYQKGLMYFAQNDPRVPANIREPLQEWGLPADEFMDNDHWPHQIYVREARRMIGKTVMTEHEVMNERPVTGSVGMGSYALDSHNVRRHITEEGFVQNEGDIGVHPHGPYAIGYDCLVPRDDEIQNLLVPVCLSSSHIAFGSIRMEPVFMVLGQSTATAAALAIQRGVPVQQVDIDSLQERLVADGQILQSDG